VPSATQTRLAVALALRDGGELCVCDLTWIVKGADNLVSHHVRALRAAGLAEYRRDGKMALCSLTPRGLALLDTADHAVPA
jgi:DNA-binding transcriptional ArsR family regulator